MRSLSPWFLVLLFAVLVSSCGDTGAKVSVGDSEFKNIYPDCEMNSAIQFLSPQGEHRSGKLINLNIQNTSKYSIVFPDDFNVKIWHFDLKTQAWVEIRNTLQNVTSSDPFSVLEPANSGLGSYSVVLIIPDLSSDVATVARVVIAGNFPEDSEKAGGCVGAFIDIEIFP